VARLLEARETATRRGIAEPDALDRLRGEIVAALPVTKETAPPSLAVLVRTQEQLEAILSWKPRAPLAPPALVYCDFEDVRRYRDAVACARSAGMPVGLAPLRIVKPGEEGLVRTIAGHGADVLLVRNLASLALFREHAPRATLVGDFSLNVANELTAALLAEQGLARLVPSYDLNWEQLAAMLGRIAPGLFEVVIHQHIPMFHMEHCVFAAFLSHGNDWRDCGRPCDRHRVELRDRVGAEFPVLADTGCRNTVFNAVAQSAAEFLPRMRALGLRHFRVELLRETEAQVGPLLEQYARVLAGLDDGRGTWRHLQAINQLGVTRGTLSLL
jgi:putative protease